MNIQWFKNIQLFTLQKPLEHNAESLHQALSQKQFRPCGDYELKTVGWIPPLQDSEMLTFEANNCILLRLRIQEKILPASVIRDFVNDKVAEIEAAELRNVRRKERNEIKEQVTQALLPRAFPKNTDVMLYLDMSNHWLLVDMSSRNKAEDVSSFLRATLGSLPVVSPQFQVSPSLTMTQWLKNNETPTAFVLGEACKLVASEGESVTCKQMDLLSSEIHEHLNTGKMVEYIALSWDNRLDLVLDENFGIKRLRFSDIEQEGEQGDEQADFMVMTSEFARLVKALFEVLGDLVEDDSVVV
ncbi:recombination-associated protein RdgC [Candidatus Albibeggiatoa sp. nov. BB20]|uniref:recombination-associated protein RdgC n=1 Tax=Candidatus Albibeggiatoa sp. nov. BB20 TaxID=3162723 RepID=UPI0033655EAA